MENYSATNDLDDNNYELPQGNQDDEDVFSDYRTPKYTSMNEEKYERNILDEDDNPPPHQNDNDFGDSNYQTIEEDRENNNYIISSKESEEGINYKSMDLSEHSSEIDFLSEDIIPTKKTILNSNSKLEFLKENTNESEGSINEPSISGPSILDNTNYITTQENLLTNSNHSTSPQNISKSQKFKIDSHSDWNTQFHQINLIEDQDRRNSKLSTITKNFHFSAIVNNQKNKKITKNIKNKKTNQKKNNKNKKYRNMEKLLFLKNSCPLRKKL